MKLQINHLDAWHIDKAGIFPVLKDVNFSTPHGEICAVLGPSGSGKTTLLRVLAGLHRQFRGSIEVAGTHIDHLPPERRGVGLVPQDGALFPHLTVRQNIGFGLPRAERGGKRVEKMLELLNLSDLANRFPHQISGGQAQRVAVARALAPAPKLILLDEPFSALDASLRQEIRDSVREAILMTGTTALLVTHDQSEALSMATQLVVLKDGQVRQQGAPSAIYENPVDLWTGQFLGEANLLPGVSDGETIQTPLGVLTSAGEAGLTGEVTVLVRPEHIQLRARANRGESQAIGRVAATRYFGHDGIVDLELPGNARVLARTWAGEMPVVGDELAIEVNGPVTVYHDN